MLYLEHWNKSLTMHKFSKIAKNLKESQLQHCLNIPNIQDYLSLGLGLPSPDTFPKSLSMDGIAMQYAPPSLKLKSQIKELVSLREINCNEDEIFLTSGAQQAISLLVRLFCEKDDIVLCEELTYFGFIQAAQSVGAKIETIYQDTFSGISAEQLEEKIKSLPKKPKLIYLIPDGHNPTSVSLALEKRQEIVKVAVKYEIPIIEDDAYGFLSYHHCEEEYSADAATQKIHKPGGTLYSQDHNNIFYINTFSKTLAPSLRVGYMIVPKEFHQKLAIIKEASDLNTSSFAMGLVSKFMEEHSIEEHIASISKLYKEKRDIMADAIEKHLSNFVTYTIPQSGIYFWLETVEDIDSMELYERALKEKLIIMPGSAFAVSDPLMGRNGIRLNFSYPSKEDIEEGVRRLAKTLGNV